MKSAPILFVCLLGMPMAAQNFEAGIFLGQQKYAWVGIPAHGPSTSLTYTPDNKTAYGVRFGYSVATFGPASFQFTAGFQPESTSTVISVPAANSWDFKETHGSVGVMFNFKALMAWGAGLENRLEKLSGNQYGRTDSTTSNRVWARLNAGYAFPGPMVKPFFGVEYAFPLSGSNHQGSYSSQTDYLKAMAPKSQFGIYTGVRF
jgi:hypothetical protein